VRAFRSLQNQIRLDHFAFCLGVAEHVWLTKVGYAVCQVHITIHARYGKSCVSSVSQCTYVALSSYCMLPLTCYARN